jgi:hypothetical protein
MSTSTLVPHIENSEKKDHEVPAVTDERKSSMGSNGTIFKI